MQNVFLLCFICCFLVYSICLIIVVQGNLTTTPLNEFKKDIYDDSLLYIKDSFKEHVSGINTNELSYDKTNVFLNPLLYSNINDPSFIMRRQLEIIKEDTQNENVCNSQIDSPTHLNPIIICLLATLLAGFSAIFSGLTLGLMMLDVVQLRVLIAASEKAPQNSKAYRDAKQAKRIYMLRKDGNLLLVTLIVSNVSVNAAFSIILSDLTNRIFGFLISTIIITLVGEIAPQALCSRYALAIGYYLCPIIFVLEVVLYIIVKPVAMLLDCLLGRDLGTQYNREQLKALLGHHEKEVKLLNTDETRILSGGLDVAVKTVEFAMTPLDQVFGLDVETILDFDVAAEMIISGYSRIPVFDRSQQQCVIGVLYTKDLALIDPSLQLSVRSALAMFGRAAYCVDVQAKLLDILKEFKKGRAHLAVVREVVESVDGFDPYYIHVGIITLEDVIEEILQDEIFDEYENCGHYQQNKGPLHMTPSCNNRFHLNQVSLSTTPIKKNPIHFWKPSCCKLNCLVPKKRRITTHQLKSTTDILPSHPNHLYNNNSVQLSTEEREADPEDEHVFVQLSVGAFATLSPQISPTDNKQSIPLSDYVIHIPKKQMSITDKEYYLNIQQIEETSITNSQQQQQQQLKPIIESNVPSRPIIHLNNSYVPQKHLEKQQVSSQNTEDPTIPCVTTSTEVVDPSENTCGSISPMTRFPSTPSNHSGTRAMLGRLRLFDRRRKLEPLSTNEAIAISLFLTATQKPFHCGYIHLSILQRLLEQCPIIEPTSCMFTRGTAADYMILILQGRLLVVSGNDDIDCFVGPWKVLGSRALGPPNVGELKYGLKFPAKNDHSNFLTREKSILELDKRIQHWEQSYHYIPDFSATPHPLPKTDGDNRLYPIAFPNVSFLPTLTEPTVRCIQISRYLYLRALRGNAIVQLVLRVA